MWEVWPLRVVRHWWKVVAAVVEGLRDGTEIRLRCEERDVEPG